MSYQHCNGKHDLRDISYRRDGTPGVVRMTRWCANCGGAVIDVDVDGRTQPGAGMPMRFPRIAAAGMKGPLPLSDEKILALALEAGFRAPAPSDGYMGLAYDRRDAGDTGSSLIAFARAVLAAGVKENDRA